MNRLRLAMLAAACTIAACKPTPAVTPTEDATANGDATAGDDGAITPTPSDDGAAEPAPADEGGAEPPASDDGGGEPGTAAGVPEAGKKYDLVVSFISPGDGTDHEAATRLDAIVAQTKGLVRVSGRWGREGEHDECFTLGELAAAKRTAFIARVRKEVGNSKKVNIEEAAECKHQAR